MMSVATKYVNYNISEKGDVIVRSSICNKRKGRIGRKA